MHLIFATDIHHCFRGVTDLLARTEADITILSDDLVSRAFYRYKTAWRFMELQQTLEGYRNKVGKGADLYDLALDVANLGTNSFLRDNSQEYLKLADEAESFLGRSYERLEEILRQFPNRAIYVLPGNYDMGLKHTSLGKRDLHLKMISCEGLRLAGYGGARVRTPGMPDHLQVVFHETMTTQGLQSEPLIFFKKIHPDILALHEPPMVFLILSPGWVTRAARESVPSSMNSRFGWSCQAITTRTGVERARWKRI